MRVPVELDEIKRELSTGESPPSFRIVTVRMLLGWFGFKRRGRWVVLSVRAGLKERELVTKPDFESAWIDGEVKVLLQPAAEAPPVASPSIDEAESTPQPNLTLVASVTDNDVEGPSVPLTDAVPRLGNLAAANNPPVSVQRQTSVIEASTRMAIEGYSQLPVMSGDRQVVGLVSWASMGRTRIKGIEPRTVGECMDRPPPVLSMNEPLFEAVKEVIARGIVLVMADDRTIAGIVTPEDISSKFVELTTPFLLIGEIETQVRNLLTKYFDKPTFQSARDPGDTGRVVETAADLSFGEYVRLLENPDHWKKLSWTCDRAQFCNLLRQVGRIRNDVMHFDPDGVLDDDIVLLRKTAIFLQEMVA